MVTREEGSWGMGIKEATCGDEHRVMDGSVDSLYCTLETNTTLGVS